MSLTQSIFTFITSAISAGGYPAIFALTVLDSTVLPVPNEAIMPFAGFLVSQGRFSFLLVILLAVCGGVLGSLTSYAIGRYGAEPFVRRFGTYVRMAEADLAKTHAMFEKYGEAIILVSRFIPVVRQFISIPAGAARMALWKFMLYTAIGTFLWSGAILYGGFVFGSHWASLEKYTDLFNKITFAAFLAAAGYVVWKKRKK